MWRAFFLAVGLSMVILGAECLVLDRVVLNQKKEKPAAEPVMFLQSQPSAARPREIQPPEWAPWSLLGAGTVIMLYSFTLRRSGG